MPNLPAPKIKFNRHLPGSGRLLRMGLRPTTALVAIALQTIHPNPGPMGRDKSEGGKAARRERRKEKRKEKRRNREVPTNSDPTPRMTTKVEVVTWNVQGMAMRSGNRVKLREVAAFMRRQRWDVVLLTELRAVEEGVVWLGQDEEQVVVVHSERAGVMMTGEVMKGWSEGGMMRKMSKRTVSVKVKGVQWTSTYQPVWDGGNSGELEEEKEILAEHVGWRGKEEILVIGGDLNAHVGGGERRGGQLRS